MANDATLGHPWRGGRSPGSLGTGARALASGTYGDFWIYLVGPLAGAIAAAFGYRWLALDR